VDGFGIGRGIDLHLDARVAVAAVLGLLLFRPSCDAAKSPSQREHGNKLALTVDALNSYLLPVAHRDKLARIANDAPMVINLSFDSATLSFLTVSLRCQALKAVFRELWINPRIEQAMIQFQGLMSISRTTFRWFLSLPFLSRIIASFTGAEDTEDDGMHLQRYRRHPFWGDPFTINHFLFVVEQTGSVLWCDVLTLLYAFCLPVLLLLVLSFPVYCSVYIVVFAQ
jgi:hypothetical protein